MKLSIRRAVVSILLVLLVAACSNKEQLTPGAPEWLLTYDRMGKWQQELSDEFRLDSTRFNENERELYHKIQNRWGDLLAARSDMIKRPESYNNDINGSDSTGRKTVRKAGVTFSASDDASAMNEFKQKARGLLGSYESLAYLMKGVPGRAVIDTTLQRAMRTQRILLRQISNDTLSTNELAEFISPAEIVVLYKENCADCHGEHGEGSSDVYPPIDRTSIASKDKEALIKVVLQGLEGPVVVGSRRYDGAMPSFRASLSDAQIAALLRYVRKMAGASNITVKTSEITHWAKKTASRTEPYSPSELNINQ